MKERALLVNNLGIGHVDSYRRATACAMQLR